jgi:hemerythrin-like domain-containing protein
MSSSPVKPHDALKFLAADYNAISAQFRDDEAACADAAARLCRRLSVHIAIKEEVFYPAVAAVLGEKAAPLLARARAQAGGLRGAIDAIESMTGSGADVARATKALGEQAHRHFVEEETELLPRLRHVEFDVAGVGEKLATKQAELSTKRK